MTSDWIIGLLNSVVLLVRLEYLVISSLLALWSNFGGSISTWSSSLSCFSNVKFISNGGYSLLSIKTVYLSSIILLFWGSSVIIILPDSIVFLRMSKASFIVFVVVNALQNVLSWGKVIKTLCFCLVVILINIIDIFSLFISEILKDCFLSSEFNL